MSARTWLSQFATLCANGNPNGLGDAFTEDAFWRDYLPFGWSLQTLEGRAAISQFGATHGPRTAIRNIEFEGDDTDLEGLFRFQTNDGDGRGHIRLENGRCKTLFTMLETLASQPATAADQTEPFVLIAGGGQGGLALGAHLADLHVPYLIIDKHPRAGGQWRSRYDSLVLHDPVWYDHLPFKPFPKDWPVFTPKDQMADWLERYAAELGLNIWPNTELTGARYDGQSWTAQLAQNGKTIHLKPTHLVLALGLSGFPNMPEIAGQELFEGEQIHSSAYHGGARFAGQNIVVVGANNSAHDIAADLVKHNAQPTLLQRSSSLVVRQDDFCRELLGPLYSAEAIAKGITTDKADILQAAMPLKLMEPKQRLIWDKIRSNRRDYYQKLTDAGFCLDFAEDGAGMGMKYRRTASGYYIDVGAAEMVMDGRIAIKSGHGISHLSQTALHLDNGETLDADAIIYATGYGNMTDWVAALIDQATADRVGPCWGYGSGTKGDPGPWLGELRNMWLPTAQDNLWFTGGNLAQARFYSRLLALQLAKRFQK